MVQRVVPSLFLSLYAFLCLCSSSSSSFDRIYLSVSLLCLNGSFPLSLFVFVFVFVFFSIQPYISIRLFIVSFSLSFRTGSLPLSLPVVLRSTISIGPSLYCVVPDLFLSLMCRFDPVCVCVRLGSTVSIGPSLCRTGSFPLSLRAVSNLFLFVFFFFFVLLAVLLLSSLL